MTHRKKFFTGLVVVVLALAFILHPTDADIRRKMIKSSVMITNLKKNSGGSGVILFSGPSASFVLTNGHICNVAKNGGLVIDYTGRSSKVISYRMSKVHDLCLLKVGSDLHVETTLAHHAPFPYETTATIVGHPQLLPIIVTTGVFSANHIVSVMIDSKECGADELADPIKAIVCASQGRLPIIKNYDATAVGALIQPGSSGSPVFNAAGELEALVFAFAGSGSIGFAEAVPFEYIARFINEEVKTVVSVHPDYTVSISSSEPQESIAETIKRKCHSPANELVKTLCNKLEKNELQ